MRIVFFFTTLFLFHPKLQSQNEIQPVLSGGQTDTIYSKDQVDSEPVFPGGEKAMFSMVYQNMRYPADAREKGIKGTCILSFIIEKDGTISHPAIVQHVYPSIDLEVMRMSKFFDVQWEPAIKNGQPVRYEYRAPLRFILQ